jgi:DNA-binding response OmpR family regulator
VAVLLVEDDLLVAKALSRALNADGYDILLTSDR